MPPVHPAHSWHIFSIRIKNGRLSIGRDEFIARLSALKIGTSVHFIPLHTMKYWSERYGLKPSDFPEAYDKFSRSISIPIWHGMSRKSATGVIDAVHSIIKGTRV